MSGIGVEYRTSSHLLLRFGNSCILLACPTWLLLSYVHYPWSIPRIPCQGAAAEVSSQCTYNSIGGERRADWTANYKFQGHQCCVIHCGVFGSHALHHACEQVHTFRQTNWYTYVLIQHSLLLESVLTGEMYIPSRNVDLALVAPVLHVPQFQWSAPRGKQYAGAGIISRWRSNLSG